MSVNFNAGLFMQNYHMQGNAVQKAPAASLSTPLTADKAGLSFNRAENKLGFGTDTKALRKLIAEVEQALGKPTEDAVSLLSAKLEGVTLNTAERQRLAIAIQNAPPSALKSRVRRVAQINAKGAMT